MEEASEMELGGERQQKISSEMGIQDAFEERGK